ncbi:2-succinyl-5-enolpyruvyl-6-hydroxy-3-cyclohexene-1-carboxylic-acid synthase [Halocatena halophila]|uniref:2-succinyl-5-enolpyruvyl-6-hydroxy-3- cyclohexene-1-carboxylic-acid synthase n=1 Tax=Halocatena halophila TaxID=2814576 RepID=UPI002ED10B9D
MDDAFSNTNTLWASVIVDELATAGVERACVAPGSRNTPLTVALSESDAITVYSQFDERSAGFFALGQARATGTPTALVCTSGTATANFHPAVIEANQARIPLIILTADRPRVLHHSGANQTVDQEGLYGGAVRTYRTLPEPAVNARKLRALRTAIDRAVLSATGDEPGPVHYNVPFEKPLEPTPTDDVSRAFLDANPEAVYGRDGPFVSVSQGTRTPIEPSAMDTLVRAIQSADRGLIVAGPDSRLTPDACASLARTTGFVVLADPVSGLRFGPHVESIPVFGGYDGYLDEFDRTPDLVLRFGQSPTSKRLRSYLETAETRQYLLSPAGRWDEATFTATDLWTTDPVAFVAALSDRLSPPDTPETEWVDAFRRAESRHYSMVADDETHFEGGIISDTIALTPDPSTLFVSNSMPVRDLDRFGAPTTTSIAAYANRGASGIDGIISTALGIGSTTDDQLIVLTGDLAFYHDMNGLLAIDRCDVDATIVLLNNDGGGIFNMLPIESFDPPFTEYFNTPHGLTFDPVADLYDLEYDAVQNRESFREAYRRALKNERTHLIEVSVDDDSSHRHREQLDAQSLASSED